MARLKNQKPNKTRNKTMHRRVWSEIKYCKTKKKSINLAFYIQQNCFSKTKTEKKKKMKTDFLTQAKTEAIHYPYIQLSKKKLRKEVLQAEGKTYIGQNLGST